MCQLCVRRRRLSESAAAAATGGDAPELCAHWCACAPKPANTNPCAYNLALSQRLDLCVKHQINVPQLSAAALAD